MLTTVCFVCSAPHPWSRLGKLFPWHISSCRLASRAHFTLYARFVQRAWTLAYLALPPSLVSEDAVLLWFSDMPSAAPSEGSRCHGRCFWLEVSGVLSFRPADRQTDRQSAPRTLSYVMTLQGINDLFVRWPKKEQHCARDTYQSLECRWWPINEGLGSGEGPRHRASICSNELQCSGQWRRRVSVADKRTHTRAHIGQEVMLLLCSLL